jgi:threonine dehydratase
MMSDVLWDRPVALKLEQFQHTGSYKARGAFNTLAASDVPEAGIVAASGGNHGAAVAYAARMLGYRARIFVPEIAGPAKIALIERSGADLTVVPGEYADAADMAKRFELERGAMQVHAYDAHLTVAGQGTLMREWEAQGLEAAGARDRLLALYRELDAYPEVAGVLKALRAAGLRIAVLSNATPDMLNAAIASAGLADLIDDVLSAQTAGVFKPAPAVYDLVEHQIGFARDEVLFVSSNGWDAAGAQSFGFDTVWVNRTGLPQDRLMAAPAHVLTDLAPIPDMIAGG